MKQDSFFFCCCCFFGLTVFKSAFRCGILQEDAAEATSAEPSERCSAADKCSSRSVRVAPSAERNEHADNRPTTPQPSHWRRCVSGLSDDNTDYRYMICMAWIKTPCSVTTNRGGRGSYGLYPAVETKM